MTTYLMKFTEEEIEVIYLAFEAAQPDTFDAVQEPVAETVIGKCCANKIGPDAHFEGAIGVLYE